MTAAKKAEDLVYFSGQNVIELHAALSTGDALEEPERMVFDFDPSEDDFGKVRQLVRTFKRILDAADITAFVSTTGSRGLHVHVPLRPGAQFQQSKSVAKALAQKLHGAEPEISTLEQRKSKRGNKVFIDTLRNAYGQTFILPYSLRAQKQAPVATPVRWDELDSSDFSAQSYTLANILQRLSQVENPWKNYARSRQSIDSLISKTN